MSKVFCLSSRLWTILCVLFLSEFFCDIIKKKFAHLSRNAVIRSRKCENIAEQLFTGNHLHSQSGNCLFCVVCVSVCAFFHRPHKNKHENNPKRIYDIPFVVGAGVVVVIHLGIESKACRWCACTFYTHTGGHKNSWSCLHGRYQSLQCIDYILP